MSRGTAANAALPVAGDEVAQLYIATPAVAGYATPRLALQGFTRVALSAGQRRQLQFTLDAWSMSVRSCSWSVPLAVRGVSTDYGTG